MPNISINTIITLTLTACILVATTLFPNYAHAQTPVDSKDAICKGIGAVSGSDGCEDPDGTPDVDSTLANVINILSIIVAVISVIMIIVGGIRFVTSSGEASSTASARNTVIYALVGLIIVALAQIIVMFVIERSSNPLKSPPDRVVPPSTVPSPVSPPGSSTFM